jgi:hypothetical protein
VEAERKPFLEKEVGVERKLLRKKSVGVVAFVRHSATQAQTAKKEVLCFLPKNS